MSPETIEAQWIDYIDENISVCEHQKKWLLENYNIGSSLTFYWGESACLYYAAAMVRDDELHDLVIDNIDDDSRIDAQNESFTTDRHAWSKLVLKNVETIMLTYIALFNSFREDFDESIKVK